MERQNLFVNMYKYDRYVISIVVNHILLLYISIFVYWRFRDAINTFDVKKVIDIYEEFYCDVYLQDLDNTRIETQNKNWFQKTSFEQQVRLLFLVYVSVCDKLLYFNCISDSKDNLSPSICFIDFSQLQWKHTWFVNLFARLNTLFVNETEK